VCTCGFYFPYWGEGFDIRNVGFSIVWFGFLDGSSFEMKATNERKREKESVEGMWKCGKGFNFYGETLFPTLLPKVTGLSLIDQLISIE